MGKAADYRANAEVAVRLAAAATDPDDKALLLKIAQGWPDLAERASSNLWFRLRGPAHLARKSSQGGSP